MSQVLSTINNHVMTISINRVEKKNALTLAMYQDMADALVHANDNESVKVVLIKGEGEAFTAGNDIEYFAQRRDGDTIAEINAFMQALATCTCPVVAEVRGVAVGIGTTLLLHCDLVYSAPNTRFCLPFINLGLVPEYASSYILPRIAGRRKASEWLMLGEAFGADEALQFGILTDIVPADKLTDTVQAVCNKLAAKPVFALQHTKQLMSNEHDAIEKQISAELDVFLEALASDAAKEAFDAFLNKRPVNTKKFK
ncbi:enoyl-CoA hydratase [Aestuariibacter sp. A3R04]|uniref:enoyl-CoA hydratase n=1 Tax=Aestuariibacter sp. A3R04 TaxID=2841571 RepID=UPI001C07FE59|nr:enoyl-CoA hydratase [Aestuariibacter sp. A3R04]MBU3022768.1 enoyl-CoA hydratase [Aestuariibacter sp. A3R04]